MNICSARLGKHIPVTAMCKHGHDWQSLLSYRSANLNTAAVIPGNSTGFTAVCMTLSYVIYWISSLCSYSFTASFCTFPLDPSACGMWPLQPLTSWVSLRRYNQNLAWKLSPALPPGPIWGEREWTEAQYNSIKDYYVPWLQNWCYNILIIGYCCTK